MEKIKELIKILNNASYEYYVNSKNILDDIQYDKLYDELVNLENKTGIIYGNSPTQKVGFTVLSSLNKVTHDSPMLSLDKTKEIEKLKSFLGNNEGLLSWKMDGLTVVLTYENGNLIQALTRGNGAIGEDITHNAKLFYNLPQKIKFKEKLIIRGEAVITFESFKKINEKLPPETQYKNPRNLCSGTVRQLNNEVVSSRQVYFYAFQLVNNDIVQENNKSQAFVWLKEQGFDVVENIVVNENNLENVIGLFSDKINKLSYGTDGLVLTYNSYEYSKALGTTSKFPKDSIAFKWKDELAKTKIINVEWNTSRTGVVTPVAIFEPVELEGTTVNRASLHNISVIESLQLGIGDYVNVYKANMIIPQIAENLTCSKNLKIPDVCPTCGETTKIIQAKDGKALYCTNEKCSAKLIDSMVHFTSRNAMDIEGLSEATIEKFVELEILKDFTDIYKLSEFKEKIMSTEGFGEKSYNKLMDAIEKSKKVKIANFIYSLGISGVGLSNAKILVNKIVTNNNLENIFTATQEKLIEIEGFGEIIAKNIVSYFSNTENLSIVKKLLTYLDFEKEEEKSEIMNGVTVVITGSLFKFENREELSKVIEKNGGKVSSSVSKNTTFLINNDNTSASSKNKKANDLGIEILTEEEFIDKFSL